MGREKYAGYVKTGSVYIIIVVSFVVGMAMGSILTIFKSTGTTGGQPATVTQQQNGAHDLKVVENQVIATPNDPEAWTHLGNAYFDTDQHAKAIEAYGKALELAPGNPNILTDLGVMYRRDGQPDQALLVFEQAIQADPLHEQARMNKGVVLFYDKKDRTAAFQEWDELLAVNPMARIPSGKSLKDFMAELSK